MQRSYILIFALFATGVSAGEWVLPWVATKDAEWRSEVVLNNLGTATAILTLTAVRPDGTSETVTQTVNAGSQLALAARDLFPMLGGGSGYSIFCSADSDSLSIAARVASVQSASGFSPSMGSAVSENHASATLVFPTMPADGFSAPVIVNLSDQEGSASVTAHTAAGQLGEPVNITLPARASWVGLATALFPELSEGAYLMVTGDTAMVGANFSFNDGLEPSLINAVPGTEVHADELEPLLVALGTTATLADAYIGSTSSLFDKQQARECPMITSDISITQPEQFIVATVDYGSGCNDILGIFHSGSIGLNLAREGGLSGGWMTGMMDFSDFNSSYAGNTAEIDGTVAVEGSTLSKNFMLSADLALSADAPTYGTSGDLVVNAMLNVNLDDTVFRAFGQLKAEVDALYTYTVSAAVASGDPLVYDFNSCIWPSDGRVDFTLDYSGQTIKGWIDFGTGTCTTAILNVRNQQETIDLSLYY